VLWFVVRQDNYKQGTGRVLAVEWSSHPATAEVNSFESLRARVKPLNFSVL
jgi:hypothetical protein